MFDYAALNDGSLQKLAMNGDVRAEEALLERYTPLVIRCAANFSLKGGERTDLDQEGLCGLLSAIRSFDENKGASFSTYAEHCIRMRLISAVKSATRLKHFPLNDSMSFEQLSEESDPRLSAVPERFQRMPEDLVLARESRKELYAAVSDCLSCLETDVFTQYLEGMSYQQIADRIGKSPKSVDNAMQRIRRKLARKLNLGDISSS